VDNENRLTFRECLCQLTPCVTACDKDGCCYSRITYKNSCVLIVVRFWLVGPWLTGPAFRLDWARKDRDFFLDFNSRSHFNRFRPSSATRLKNSITYNTQFKSTANWNFHVFELRSSLPRQQCKQTHS